MPSSPACASPRTSTRRWKKSIRSRTNSNASWSTGSRPRPPRTFLQGLIMITIRKVQQRCCYVLALCLLATPALAQNPPQQTGPGADLVKQGVAADLAGNYADARKAFAQAIE